MPRTRNKLNKRAISNLNLYNFGAVYCFKNFESVFLVNQTIKYIPCRGEGEKHHFLQTRFKGAGTQAPKSTSESQSEAASVSEPKSTGAKTGPSLKYARTLLPLA